MNRHDRRARARAGRKMLERQEMPVGRYPMPAGVNRDDFSSDLDGLMRFAQALVLAQWTAAGHGFPPWLVIAEKPLAPPLVFGFHNPDPGDLAWLQDLLASEGGTTRCAKILDAWTGALDSPMPPSQDPERGEAIVIFARDVVGRRLTAAAEIKRLDGVATLLPWIVSEAIDGLAGLLGIVSGMPGMATTKH